MSLQILSIGIIGRHLQPLYIQYYTKSSRQDPLLKWHYACHMALDIFDERDVANVRPSDGYLGLLYTMDDYAVYGYTTNTRLRFVLILGLADTVIKDLELKSIFKSIHTAYISYVCNPFSTIPQENLNLLMAPIHSKKFEKTLEGIVKTSLNPVETVS